MLLAAGDLDTTDKVSKSVVILGVRVACMNIQDILDSVERWRHEPVHRFISYVNAHCLNTAYTDSAYQAVLADADIVYADGVGVVLASRLLRGCRLHKATGADWIADFCSMAAAKQWRVYLLGSRPGVVQRATQRLVAMYPTLQIVGATDGYFVERTEAQVLADIATVAPDVVLIGMGTPRQEQWIASRREQVQAPICWAVGALFDYVAGVEQRAPAWMRRMALEWLWRLLVDPVGKGQRYLAGNPLFVWRVLQQRWRHRHA